MRTFSILTAIAIAATTVLTPVAAHAQAANQQQGEVSNSAQFVFRALRRRGIYRPSHRSVERLTDQYRSEMAASRRSFQKKLDKIEEIRDTLRDEYSVTPDEGQTVDKQGFVPFNWYRTRRHVRSLYWQNYFQQNPGVKTGEGPAGQQKPVAN